jgi:FlaA1/EpsC-like NDP-sugar epimerase
VLAEQAEYNLYRINLDVTTESPDVDVEAVICDVRDREAVRALFARVQPDIVFHAAALKHVPIVEANPIEGAATNILGTVNVADAAIAAKASAMVLISTDKAVNPTNVMGATKRFAEAYCQNLDQGRRGRTRFMTVRFGNVLGSTGSVVPLFARQIAAGGPVTVTHPDIERYFMTIREAVRLVLAASGLGLADRSTHGRILVLNMGKPVKIVDLARRMVQLSGLRPGIDIEIVFTGLRPGEKLFEERLARDEHADGSEHPWLSIASPRGVPARELEAALAAVGAAVAQRDQTALAAALRRVVPEYGAPTPPADAPVSLEDARRLRGLM